MRAELPEGKKKTPDLISALIKREQITPDFYILREFEEFPLFVYDELKKTFDGHQYLRGAKYLGKAHTLTDHYKMYMYRDRYPVVMQCGIGAALRYKVRGELYLVNVEHICAIDHLQDHCSRMLRHKIKIGMEEQNPLRHRVFRRTPFTDAFIYLGIPEKFEDSKLEGCPLKHVKKKGHETTELMYEFLGDMQDDPFARSIVNWADHYPEYSYQGLDF